MPDEDTKPVKLQGMFYMSKRAAIITGYTTRNYMVCLFETYESTNSENEE